MRVVSGLIGRSYESYCRDDVLVQRVWVVASRVVQMVLFLIARIVDQESMTTQMIEESWWG